MGRESRKKGWKEMEAKSLPGFFISDDAGNQATVDWFLSELDSEPEDSLKAAANLLRKLAAVANSTSAAAKARRAS